MKLDDFDVKLGELIYFVWTYREASFTDAARRISDELGYVVTPDRVERWVKELGRKLHRDLFVANGPVLRRTRDADELYRQISPIVSAWRDQVESSDRLTILASIAIALEILPQALANLCAPGDTSPTVIIRNERLRDVVRGVTRGEADVAVGGFAPQLEIPDELQEEPIGKASWCLLIPNNSAECYRRLVEKTRSSKNIELPDLVTCPWITHPLGSNTRASHEEAFRKAGLEPPKPRLELPGSAAHRSAVAKGLGIALVSALSKPDPDEHDPRVIWANVRSLFGYSDYRCLYRKKTTKERLILSLLQQMRTVWRKRALSSAGSLA